ncbi:CGNR zinc finger domain-containing protein [Kibdelosporangium aridum]|uniref:CGNR zinc finger domain-containing protein n=1 Tax=Kibdelosporangium aridum TaxID=2030 RepID=A0A428ZSA2_KIBAR|nr:CGNR zinc finger domain-containing protein [Kibdelosporangium aridum]RSM90871.1 CGNR zinc finger domain-containing protein [Kibdelosporangium aridum]
MNFDSHTSDVVAAAVEAVNVLTPGHALGRDYSAEDPDIGALTSGSTPSEKDVDELRGYATRLRAIFEAVEDGQIDEACVVTNALLADTQAVPRLIKHDGEPWHMHFHAGSASWARGWAASMATALAIVLGNPMADRLGVCTATACDRVFVDVSRNGTKRFCSTACQNRIKAAAFRARKQV